MAKKKGAKKKENALPSTLATGAVLQPASNFPQLVIVEASKSSSRRRREKLHLPVRPPRLPPHVVRAVETDDVGLILAWLNDEGNDIAAVWDSSDGAARGYTLLMCASLCGHEKLVHDLLRRGAAVNASLTFGDGVTLQDVSALTLAEGAGREAVAQRLRFSGAITLEPKDQDGRPRPFGAADAARARLHLRSEPRPELPTREEALGIKNLTRPGAKSSDEVVPDAVMDAAAGGDLKVVAGWLEDSGGRFTAARVDAYWRQHSTLLMVASESGNEALAELLLARGADTSLQRATDAATCLSLALLCRHRAIVSILMQHDTAMDTAKGPTRGQLGAKGPTGVAQG